MHAPNDWGPTAHDALYACRARGRCRRCAAARGCLVWLRAAHMARARAQARRAVVCRRNPPARLPGASCIRRLLLFGLKTARCTRFGGSWRVATLCEGHRRLASTIASVYHYRVVLCALDDMLPGLTRLVACFQPPACRPQGVCAAEIQQFVDMTTEGFQLYDSSCNEARLSRYGTFGALRDLPLACWRPRTTRRSLVAAGSMAAKELGEGAGCGGDGPPSPRCGAKRGDGVCAREATSLRPNPTTHCVPRRYAGINWDRSKSKWRSQIGGVSNAKKTKYNGQCVDTQEQAAQQYAW